MFCIVTKVDPPRWLADTGSVTMLRWVEDKRGAQIFDTEEAAYRRALFFDIATQHFIVEPFKKD